MIKGLFFDLDGTLVDAKEWHFEALNLALTKHNFIITRSEHEEVFDGIPTSKKLELLTRLKSLPPDLYSQIKEDKNKYTFEILEKTDIFNQDIYDTFKYYSEQGYIIEICSNSISRFVHKCINKMKLDFFCRYLSNEDVLSPKPSPEMYLAAIRRNNLLASEVLIFEDNENGIRAAKDSGAFLQIVQSPKDVNINFVLNSINSINY